MIIEDTGDWYINVEDNEFVQKKLNEIAATFIDLKDKITDFNRTLQDKKSAQVELNITVLQMDNITAQVRSELAQSKKDKIERGKEGITQLPQKTIFLKDIKPKEVKPRIIHSVPSPALDSAMDNMAAELNKLKIR